MNIEDLNGQYAKCFALINGAEAIKINRFESDEDTVYMLYNDEKSVEYDEENVLFDIISPGLYNYKNAVVLVRRTSERQWKRGFCQGQFHVQALLGDVTDNFANNFGVRLSVSTKEFNWTIDDVKELLSSPNYTYSQAKGELDSSKRVVARAFNTNWFIMPSMDTPEGDWLFYRSCKVATIDNKRIKVVQGFEEEVSDLNRAENIGEIVC